MNIEYFRVLSSIDQLIGVRLPCFEQDVSEGRLEELRQNPSIVSLKVCHQAGDKPEST